MSLGVFPQMLQDEFRAGFIVDVLEAHADDFDLFRVWEAEKSWPATCFTSDSGKGQNDRFCPPFGCRFCRARCDLGRESLVRLRAGG